jgi:hypothetical protein
MTQANIPQVELAIMAKPATGADGDIYALTIPMLLGLTNEWPEFCAELSDHRRDELQAQRNRLGSC